MTQNTQVKTVKFEALKELAEAKKLLTEAIGHLEIVRDLQGDNEAYILAEALISSITKDRNMLGRGIRESEEFW
jgi:hypothetical protein